MRLYLLFTDTEEHGSQLEWFYTEAGQMRRLVQLMLPNDTVAAALLEAEDYKGLLDYIDEVRQEEPCNISQHILEDIKFNPDLCQK